jgi:membrane-bound lytic murein transglycosylase A
MSAATSPRDRTTCEAVPGPGGCRLACLDWAEVAGLSEDDLGEALAAFQVQARALAAGNGPTRPGVQPTAALQALLEDSLAVDPTQAGSFFSTRFRPWRIEPASGEGFLTGYYEPEAEGSLAPGADFAAPLCARPDDLVTFAPGQALPAGFDPAFSAAQRSPDGRLVPYPDRAAIEAGATRTEPLVWLRDHVEVFLIHVQGSARVRLPDGRILRLGYAGRNGRPYTSIGRLLVEQGHIALADMSLARLKAWLRDNPSAGRAIMQRNQSYIFFKIERQLDAHQGPIGAAGAPLTPLRSIAVDRQLWPYGLPFFIDARLPWRSPEVEPFRRVMVAQDTGSAILGPARADIFFGSGEARGTRAGDIRHPASFIVFLPAGDIPDGRAA